MQLEGITFKLINIAFLHNWTCLIYPDSPLLLEAFALMTPFSPIVAHNIICCMVYKEFLSIWYVTFIILCHYPHSPSCLPAACQTLHVCFLPLGPLSSKSINDSCQFYQIISEYECWSGSTCHISVSFYSSRCVNYLVINVPLTRSNLYIYLLYAYFQTCHYVFFLYNVCYLK